MIRRTVVPLICWIAITTGAAANAPESSPRPQLRPAAKLIQPLPSETVTKRPRLRPGSTSAHIPFGGTTAPSGLRPKSRPTAAQRPRVIVQKAFVTRTAPLMASVRPPARPENLRRLSQAVVFRTQPVPEATTGRKGSVCGDQQIRGTKIPTIRAKLAGCGLKDGVEVTSVAGVALSTPASMDCTTARALKTWVEGGVKPAIGRLGGGVAKLKVAAGYSCRTRNNQQGARVSEHGRGRAIDISAIILANGTAITVLKGWGSGQHGKALKKVRKAACGPFNTVLGPGSDAHHRDHFHLDTARGRGPYCR
ncbi:MAG: extensin family protein [Paracoccaceae bacterium]|nr:extensin family protein [Paracoccaceae bacterium]MDH5530863.1 extensin family protein [Paracoccaceae bacterium]